MGCGGTLIIRTGCTNVLKMNAGKTFIVSIKTIGPAGSGGGGAGGGWQEADTIEVVNAITLVQDDQLKNVQLKKIIHLNGVSANWARQGITHDNVAGTLDFTNYLYDNKFSGYIDFEFQ